MKKFIRIISLAALVGSISIITLAKTDHAQKPSGSAASDNSVVDQSTADKNASEKKETQTATTPAGLGGKHHGGPLGGAMPPAVVSAATVVSVPWQHQIQATGSLAAFEGIVLKPEIAGRITKIFFNSGQDVKQGDPLIQLNPNILQAQVEQDKANLALAQRQYQRYNDLLKEHAVAKADYDTAATTMNADQAMVNQANALLKQTTISAPFSGRLGLRQVSIGDFVSPGQTLVNLQALDPIVVNFSLPEAYLSQVAVGNTVIIRSDAFPNQTFTGKIYAFDSMIDPSTRTLAIRASVANPDKKLLPGGYVQVDVLFGKSQNVIKIPQTALVSDISGTYVYRVINGKAVKTPVVVAARENQNAIIQSGINAGDQVITDGQIKINQNDAPVMVAPNA